jgi:hypothetical protein
MFDAILREFSDKKGSQVQHVPVPKNIQLVPTIECLYFL